VHFPDGLPGYEDCRRFVLVSSPSLMPLQCLQAVGDPGASFLVTDPRLVAPGYERHAPASDLDRLGCDDPGSLLWLSILTVAEDGTMSANLGAPIVIDPDRMCGLQLIPASSAPPLRRTLPLAS